MMRLFWLLLAVQRLAPFEAQRPTHVDFGRSPSDCSDSISLLQVGAPAPRHGLTRLPVVVPVVVPVRFVANTTTGASRLALAGVSPWHPDPILWTYFVHVVAALCAGLLTLYRPSVLLALTAAPLFIWPLLLLAGWKTWGIAPLSLEWWLLFGQHFLAVAAAAVPLTCLVWQNAYLIRPAGFATLLLLEASMLWTLGYPPLTTDWIGQVSDLCVLSLSLTLLVRICVLHFGDISPFCIERTKLVLCPGCSLSWVVCFTVWSVVWAAEHAGAGATLPYILLWATMFLFLSFDEQKVRVENYFAIAYGVSSSTWVGLNRWIGLAQPFRDTEAAPRLNTYFLFISVMNFLYSFYVMYWEVYISLRPEQGGITQLLRQKSFQTQQDHD